MRSKEQYTKFSPLTLAVKARLKEARLSCGLKMIPAARDLGIARKVLEEMETTRNYGSHIDLEMLVLAAKVYGVSVSSLIPTKPKGYGREWYIKPYKLSNK